MTEEKEDQKEKNSTETETEENGLRKFTRSRRFLILMGLVAIAAVFIYQAATAPNAYAVKVDGEAIAVVAAEEQVEAAMEVLEQQHTVDGLIPNCDNVIETEFIRVAKKEILSETEFADLLRQKVAFHYDATALMVDGECMGIFESHSVAEQVVQTIKDSYLPSGDAEVRVVEVALAETVDYERVEVAREEIMCPEEAIEKLMYGEETISYYEVQTGDSFWTISEKNDVPVSVLEAANPDVNEKTLQIGQKISLVKAEPAFTVQLTYEQVAKESINFPVNYVNTDSLFRGQQRVKETGKRGSKEVTYLVTAENGRVQDKEVINEVVLEEPKAQVVSVGTKVVVASRGGGSGVLAWPKSGIITSPYGNRSGGFHTGIDINGRTGDPIYAAGSGTVIFSGWRGGYGNLVIIDHGDGLSTYYAHASKLLVKSGAKVQRGDRIALVGSTGNSTGAHLHFEVRINGKPDSPTKYLR